MLLLVLFQTKPPKHSTQITSTTGDKFSRFELLQV